jgi:uncharacterized lipoprotein YehR (DUF1307 family)
MNRLAQLSIIVLLCVALTGCEEKTGSTVYHNGDGTVTSNDYSQNHVTGQNHVRTHRYDSEQHYQQAQNNNLATRLAVVGTAIVIKVISDQWNEDDDHSTSCKLER